jgi:hypothetical protein
MAGKKHGTPRKIKNNLDFKLISSHREGGEVSNLKKT